MITTKDSSSLVFFIRNNKKKEPYEEPMLIKVMDNSSVQYPIDILIRERFLPDAARASMNCKVAMPGYLATKNY